MKNKELQPKETIKGKITVPPSKSFAQRAIALAGLSQDNIILANLGESEDVIAAKNIIESLGANFIEDDDEIIVVSPIDLDTNQSIQINCGESGLSTRLFSAFSLLYNQPFTIEGEGSINDRPMDMIVEGLTAFGKEVISNDGRLPIVISGHKNVNSVEIDGSVSSQFISGLLLVAPFLNEDTEIMVSNPTSKPYISMTLDLLRTFNLTFDQKGFNYFYIEGNQEIYRPIEYTVEGDWSAAAFTIVAAAIGGEIELTGLKKYSKQGDRKVVDAIEKSGATIKWNRNDLTVVKNEIKPFEFDATDCPDLFPALAVLASYANGKTVIKGASRLKYKESDRGEVLKEELAKIGIHVEINDDEMTIDGGTLKRGETIVFSSHNDHRIAMALSLFSIGATYPIIIEDAEAINKSYPQFFQDFAEI